VLYSPSQFSLEFSVRVAKTDGQLLLVDGKEDDSDKGPMQYSSPVSGDSKFLFLHFLISYWVISPSVGLTLPVSYTIIL
jgi:hypothetical protein